MKALLKFEFKRAFCNKYFLAAVIISLFFCFACFYDIAWPAAKKLQLYIQNDANEVLNMSKFYHTYPVLESWMPNHPINSFYYIWSVTLPLICAMPYGSTYKKDVCSGLINQLVYRGGKKNYYSAKLITAFISGGTIAVLPLVVNLILCLCFLPWTTPLRSSSTYWVYEKIILSKLFYEKPVLYIIIYLILFFIMYGLINCLCLSLSFLTDNPFITMISPFVIYYALSVIFESGMKMPQFSLMNNASINFVETEYVSIYILQLIILFLLNLSFMLRTKKSIV